MDVLKLIPQLFYDLIGRVIPGFVMLFLLYPAFSIKIDEKITDFLNNNLRESVFFILTAIIICAYLIGHFSAASFLTGWGYIRMYKLFQWSIISHYYIEKHRTEKLSI